MTGFRDEVAWQKRLNISPPLLRLSQSAIFRCLTAPGRCLAAPGRCLTTRGRPLAECPLTSPGLKLLAVS